MRTVPAGLQTELNGVSSGLCRLVTITRRNNDVVRFAEHQENLTVSAQVYTAAKGIRMSSIPFEVNRIESTVDFEITLEDGGTIDPDDLRNGLYDGAQINISAVSFVTPANGKVSLWNGQAGQVELTDRGYAKIQAIGLFSKGREIPLEHYTPTCRVDLGSPRCGVSLAPWELTRTVTGVGGVLGYSVGFSGGAIPARYRLGLLIPQSPAKAFGEAFEIRTVHSTSFVKLYIKPAGIIEAGDVVKITPGCDFTMDGTQGCAFWNNSANFQGEPHVPGASEEIIYREWGES